MAANFPHPAITGEPDMDFILSHTALKVAQAFSLAIPPLYLATNAIRRRPFSLRKFFRTVNGVTLVGTAASVPVAYYEMKDQSKVAMADRRERLALQTRADDYSIIGLTLSSLLTPTILYKRASLLSLVLGGGILGLSGGVYAHLWKSIQEGYEVKPDLEGMVADVEEAGGKAVGDVKKVVESRR